ncbi:hypothetical protein OW521_14415 [Arthrobacter sp. MMS18-M83]|nr:hypothetical protein [Arthrobacter sp. MMS18-M83]WAH95641.1 hypothetical protein OW521_14415 [Arthrobacter sp. MMS18-M83]
MRGNNGDQGIQAPDFDHPDSADALAQCACQRGNSVGKVFPARWPLRDDVRRPSEPDVDHDGVRWQTAGRYQADATSPLEHMTQKPGPDGDVPAAAGTQQPRSRGQGGHIVHAEIALHR